MRSRKTESLSFVKEGGELALPRPALIGLLQAVLSSGRVFRFRASGLSMSPCIRDGDVIVIAPLPSETFPRPGQVVAFVHPSTRQLVVHRVVAKRNRSFLLKGDGTSLADGFIPAMNLLGYVIKVEREGTRVRFGLGPERFLIAFLSRMGPLLCFLDPLWRFVRPIVRRLVL